MPYIGNTVQNQGFAPAIDYFNGNGVTVTFTLSRPLASVAQIICAIDNVIQNPSSAFTVSGNSITFTSAPLSGTNNIWVEYTSLITTYAAISQDPSVIGDITASGGYLATGDFGNSYIDGVIVDYVTGAARLTTGPLDDMVFYHGGSSARSEMMRLSYAGTNSYIAGSLGVGTATTPAQSLEVKNASIYQIRTGDGATYYDFGRNNSTGYFNFYGNQTGYTGYIFGGVDGTRMTINSSGYVTMPYQPGFMAIASLGTSFTSGAIMIFNTSVYNTGSHYNTSNGRFTAPIAGIYTFTYQALSGTGATVYRFTVYKNGSDYNLTGATDWQGIRLDCQTDINYLQGSKTITISLAAGDYIQIYYSADNGDTLAPGSWSSFQGRLVG
jgi:hypothetical protein